MARWQHATEKPGTPAEWEEAGAEAILDLLSQRVVVPWHEAEARISRAGWNGFPTVQSLQLTAARRRLLTDGKIELETSDTNPPVVTIQEPITVGRKREIERLRGERRKAYRRYLAWAGDQALCGRHAEKVLIDTAQSCASVAALWVPRQTVGKVTEVLGASIAPQTLDGLAFALNPETAANPIPIVFEVKNIHSTIYPWAPQLWELLVKAATLVVAGQQVLPVLVCAHAAFQAWQMAQDIGFFTVQFGVQLFSPTIDDTAFQEIVDEFGLLIARDDSPNSHVHSFLTKTLRRSPPPTPANEEISWLQRQVDRFNLLAPVILNFAALAEDLPDATRSDVWGGARKALRGTAQWPLVGKW